MERAMDRLRKLAEEKALVGTAADVLGWDQETYLADDGHDWRAKQLAWLSEKAHEISVSPAWQQALGEAEQSPADDQEKALLKVMRRDFTKATCLPSELIAREAELTSHAKQTWSEAKKRADFSIFSQNLQKLVDLSKEKADLIGYEKEAYDALLDTYERGATAEGISALFGSIESELRETAANAVAATQSRPVSLPAGPYPIAQQQILNAEIAASLGFEFTAGRIDTTAHPFCTTLGPRDVRLTTRYDEEDFTSSLFGVMHEAGHGLYELGLPASEFGLPSGCAASLGIHESQSRLWENHVGRSRPFWQKWYPRACELFPQLSSLEFDDFMAFISRAEKSFIRVEADEATYDLHILLRFSIERSLMSGEIQVSDVPKIWNERFEGFFGITPPDDSKGCLQDIHWAMGGLGYFPTYTLGNINAAQLFATASQIDEIHTGLAKADYAPLLKWLRVNVHHHGAVPTPAEIIRLATGAAPNAEFHLKHLKARYVGA
jgi:carboxypeptidase Taq